MIYSCGYAEKLLEWQGRYIEEGNSFCNSVIFVIGRMPLMTDREQTELRSFFVNTHISPDKYFENDPTNCSHGNLKIM